ncbi:ECF transporter S component [Clostridium algidicarnis]|uniref:ECF transporter S component n=1 Tax=Clostridium algidicarnis TaxID=37659 RepID=UPI001C0CCDA4|nr:ECF transporter S component [Clostridium algidicarnis]MBU3209573.1 ECF transporter S component [Clostridium algidicarnis]MBU3227173.1 ECF transporter S component [Clostridium algidicarnis]MBU3250698.1 ECF transporter S component [Clostridium algidicarnis]
MEKKRDNKITTTQSKIRDLIYMALMSSIVLLGTSLITIPSYNGVIHIGDSIIFISVILLGKKKGAVSSALGMFLFDILHGYTYWAPFTFIIKGSMVLIAGWIIERGETKSILKYAFAFLVSGIFMIGAYFISGALIKMLFLGEGITFTKALIVSSYDIPGNILQVFVGIIIALPLIKVVETHRIV